MSAIPPFKPPEGKREEFRKYLERNGVLAGLTKVLVNLYEEGDKPEDALEFIRDKLAVQAGLDTHKQLLSKLEEANAKIAELQGKLTEKPSETKEESAPIEEPPAPAEEPVEEPTETPMENVTENSAEPPAETAEAPAE